MLILLILLLILGGRAVGPKDHEQDHDHEHEMLKSEGVASESIRDYQLADARSMDGARGGEGIRPGRYRRPARMENRGPPHSHERTASRRGRPLAAGRAISGNLRGRWADA